MGVDKKRTLVKSRCFILYRVPKEKEYNIQPYTTMNDDPYPC